MEDQNNKANEGSKKSASDSHSEIEVVQGGLPDDFHVPTVKGKSVLKKEKDVQGVKTGSEKKDSNDILNTAPTRTEANLPLITEEAPPHSQLANGHPLSGLEKDLPNKNKESPDFFTYAGAGIAGLLALVEVANFFAIIIADWDETPAVFLGYSYLTLIVGSIVGLWAGSSTAYVKADINKKHQGDKHDIETGHVDQTPGCVPPVVSSGYAVRKVVSMAGPLLYILKNYGADAFSPAQIRILTAVIIIWGMLTSWGHRRSGSKSVSEFSEKNIKEKLLDSDDENQPLLFNDGKEVFVKKNKDPVDIKNGYDTPTIYSALGDLATTSLNSTVFTAQYVSLFLTDTNKVMLYFPKKVILPSLLVGLYAGAMTAKAHLNSNHDYQGEEYKQMDVSQRPAKAGQYCMLGGDYYGHIVENSAFIAFVVMLLGRENKAGMVLAHSGEQRLTRQSLKVLYSSAIGIGVFAGFPDVRSCKKKAQKKNEIGPEHFTEYKKI